MTARSKSRRQANRKLKAEKRKAKELKRLQKNHTDGKELMEICSEVVDEKKLEEIKKVRLFTSTTEYHRQYLTICNNFYRENWNRHSVKNILRNRLRNWSSQFHPKRRKRRERL